MTTQLTVQSDTVPAGFCPITDKDWQALVRLLRVILNGDPSINFGNATPTPDNRNKPWIRTNTDGTPDSVYVFQSGLWVSRHSLPPDAVAIYAGDPANIPTFDGGNTNAVSAYDGPFWQRLPNADAKFLVQTGTTAAPFSTALTFGQQGGEEKHTLSLTETPYHQHLLANPNEQSNNDAITLTGSNYVNFRYNATASDRDYILQGDTTLPSLGLSSAVGGNPTGTPVNSTDPHNTMPPYLVVTFIQRTARLFRTQLA